MRFSSDELDGCDFATEEDFDNPAKKGGYDEATRVVNNIQVDNNYIYSLTSVINLIPQTST